MHAAKAKLNLVAAAFASVIAMIVLGPKLGAVFLSRDVHGAEPAPAGSRTMPGQVRVTAVTVARAPFAETLTASGTILAEEDVELRSEVAGRIVSIAFREGARVRKGELLVKLDDTKLHALRQRTLHRRDLALLRERRLAGLAAQKLVRQEEYDTAASELKVQEADLAVIDAQLEKTEVRAPFDGRIGLRYVSEGAYVTPTSRLAALHRIARVKVDFPVPERYAPRLKLGAEVRIRAASGDQVLGQVYAIDPQVDEATRTCTLRALAPNASERLLPGGAVEVQLTLDEINDALFLPADAVLSSAAGKHVFVVENETAVLRAVRSGNRTEDSVQILAGLSEGDIVITSGLQQLRAGARVAIAALSQSPPAT